jgi:acetyltransferase-like isoleucine patch superfamily enzyme
MSKILLSICIPTYNRSTVLEKSIISIVSQKEFDQSVELVISDNCSDDDTLVVVEEFQKVYSNIKYYKNDENIGAEKNVFKVLSLGKGKFLKLANDYSLFNDGSIKSLIDLIIKYESTESVIFCANSCIVTEHELTECHNFNEFISKTSYWITWLLCFGIWKTVYDTLIKGTFKENNFPHTDLLLRNLNLGYKPVIYNKLIFTIQPLTSKGGYNIFEAFIPNYLNLLKQFVGKNQILKSTFKLEKSKLLQYFIFPWYCKVVIDKKSDLIFKTKGFKTYLIKYFGVRDIAIFTYKTLKYKTTEKQKFMLFRRIKKIIIKKLAKIAHKIIYSNEYQNLDKIEEIINFKSIGENLQLPTQKIIKNPQYISIGNNFFALQNLRIEAWDEYVGEKFHPEIIIGDDVIMNTEIHIGCINKIVIGNNVVFSSRILISDHSHGDITKEALSLPPALRPLKSKGPIIIEDNVWIGDGVVILSGVTVGENSIIGANSVVTKSIPANCVVVGNPVRILKTLV